MSVALTAAVTRLNQLMTELMSDEDMSAEDLDRLSELVDAMAAAIEYEQELLKHACEAAACRGREARIEI